MNAGFVLSIVASTAIGFLTLSSMWPQPGKSRTAEVALKLFLSWGFGQGLTSCMAFLYLLVHGQADGYYVPTELLACLGLAAALVIRIGKADRFTQLPQGGAERSTAPTFCRAVAVLFYVAAGTSLAVIAIKLSRDPSGGWDAWAIWNLRARSIARSGYEWLDSFSSLIDWTHPDYPLLLPLSVVRGWLYVGGETSLVASVYAWLFALSTIGVTATALALMRSSCQGYLAGLVLVGYTFFAEQSAWQYADLPLMFFFVSALVLTALYIDHGTAASRGWLILAGVAAGLAAWTKNEGILFVVALGAAHLVLVIRRGGVREYLHHLPAVAAGLMAVVALLIYFKTQLAPAGDLAGAITSTTVFEKLADFKRYKVLAKYIADEVFLHKGYGVNLTYVLLAYLVCIGLTRLPKAGAALGIAVLTLMAAGYCYVYITTPHDMDSHIRYSIDRLLLQLWPSFVFTFFLLVAGPDEALDDAPRGGVSHDLHEPERSR